MSKLSVWWIPQVPMKPFRTYVPDLEYGVLVMDVLAKYDAFQFENNVKPDYSNAGGISVLEEESGEWIDWYDEDSGEEDPETYIMKMRNES